MVAEAGGEFAWIWDNGKTNYKNGSEINSDTKESQHGCKSESDLHPCL